MGKPKYIDPFTDTGFKIIFGREKFSEEFLIDFLNEILRGEPDFDEIVSVQYGNPEKVPDTLEEDNI